jgi:asparagine synthase (glutamine-hydrolysing)
MLALLRHRGPDEFGLLLDREAGLASARLSIIDLTGGSQPISNEDRSLWLVFNGEIFNYLELRAQLESHGHQFRTSSDTEVILHLYEDLGPSLLQKLNGQFAIALWDSRARRLFLARDRFGVRPLFYTHAPDGTFLFASEIKCLLSDPRVSAEIDPSVVRQVFTYWAPLSPNTVFRGIQELPPAHYLVADRDSLHIQHYWRNAFPAQNEFTPDSSTNRNLEALLETFRDLLIDACRIRLRADVPVGAYLSGGLDSSTLAAIVRRFTPNRLVTFSIAFTDQQFDESAFQQQMAASLGTEHHTVHATHSDIAEVFPEVIWHAEVPLMRTAPAPMFLLAKLVHRHGFKVVLTGEGADEFLAGYDIFKEAKIRHFWARQPLSKSRPRLLARLYSDVPGFSQANPEMLASFFGKELSHVHSPWYSHSVRWRNNLRTTRFFADDSPATPRRLSFSEINSALPSDSSGWHPLARAQYLEVATFMSQYLLSSQGDRMAMAHSVEGRFPFLDVRLVEFCNRLDPRLKLRGLREKWFLTEAARPWLPAAIQHRPKRPYRAPIHRCFFNNSTPPYVKELLSPARLRATGIFKATAVTQLVRKLEAGLPLGETDDMALAGILSTQLLDHLFLKNFRRPEPLSALDRLGIHDLQSKHQFASMASP